MRTILVAWCLIALAACKDAGPESPIGNYALTAANGDPLPAALVKPNSHGCADVITGGSLDLRADGTYALALAFQPKAGCAASFATGGTYTLDSGAKLVSGDSVISMLHIGDHMTWYNYVDVYTFTK